MTPATSRNGAAETGREGTAATSRRAVFVPYRPKTILNTGKRADHWFWTRYSAYPYLGCQHGCAFCYCRERKYAPYDDPADFAYRIQVKENAVELLRRALQHAPRDVLFTGDYQPLDRIYLLSRRILALCLELGFPVFVLERSPLILRDLDLLQEIHRRARAVTAFSIITTPESRHYEQVRRIENLAPPVELRFAAMQKLAAAGIPVGVSLMPILPGLCDDDANLENVIRRTAEHGGGFVLAGGLTLSDQQKDYFFTFLAQHAPNLLDAYQAAYPEGSYGQPDGARLRIARKVRELCQKYGLADRMPRPIIPGEKRALNKRIVEYLADQAYTCDLAGKPGLAQGWAYRKAAWAVEDLEQDIALVYRTLGARGIRSLPEVQPALAAVIEEKIHLWTSLPPPA